MVLGCLLVDRLVDEWMMEGILMVAVLDRVVALVMEELWLMVMDSVVGDVLR